MSRIDAHVPDELLQAFVMGDVDDSVAIQVAEHIDSCPSCNTRAATAEPLAVAFAAVADPRPPTLLVEAVLRASALPTPELALARVAEDGHGPAVEIGVGLALLLLAIVLTGLGGDDPVRFAVDASRWMHGIERAVAAVGAPASAVWLGGVALVGLGALAAGSMDRGGWVRFDRRTP